MSLSPNPDGSGFLRQQQGKTPPPAPSAAFARRAREIQAEEGLGGARYRPPALRPAQGVNDNTNNGLLYDKGGGGGGNNTSTGGQTQATSLRPTLTPIDDTSNHAASSFALPPSYRRARAGTLPSNVQLAAQNYASQGTAAVPTGVGAGIGAGAGIGGHGQYASPDPTSLASSPLTTVPPPSILSAGGGSGVARPSLRHAASAAPASASSLANNSNITNSSSLNTGLGGAYASAQGINNTPGVGVGGERTSRLRSGSLTLPTGGLTDAFGPSIFSSSWLSSSGAGGPGGRGERDPGFGTLDELRSLASGDSQAGEEYDVHTVHTLDYLGLDDDGRRGSALGERGVNGVMHRGQQQHRDSTVSGSGAPRMVEMRDPNQASSASISNRHRANTVANPYRRTSARASRITEPTHDEDELEYSSGANDYEQSHSRSTNALGVPVTSYSRQRIDSYDGSGYVSANSSSNNLSGNEQQGQSPYVARGFPKSTAEQLASSARTRSTSLGTTDEQSVRRRVNNITMMEETPVSAGGTYSPYRPGSGAQQQDYTDVPVLQQPQYNVLHQQQQQQSQGSGVPTNPLLSRHLHIDTMTNVNNAQQQLTAHLGHQQQQQTPTRGTSSPSVRFPTSGIDQLGSAGGMRGSPGGGQLNVHSGGGVGHRDGRAVSPKDGALTGSGPGSGTGQGQSQIQTPSRSLWIGNLDSSVSGEDLARAFAPYGAIESFRLLPEKECGFINFVDIADAIRAKDDVLNRLGGTIGQANGQTVRIGFGKADSAPATPSGPNSGGTHSSHFLTTGGGASSRDASGASSRAGTGDGGLDAQLQNSPTRALWIGSIPSTTTPATILSVFSPFGPIESARVLTHKNCGFVNFERLDDAVRARKALNGRDVLGSDVGAIRIGFARVPVKSGSTPGEGEEGNTTGIQGVGDLSVGATIHALRGIKGASAVPADQQVLGGAVENYRSNLLLSMLSSFSQLAANGNGGATTPGGAGATTPGGGAVGTANGVPVTEQQMIMKMLGDGSGEPEMDLSALAEFRPPMAYYTTIPVAAERTNSRRWDASKLRELRKRLDSGSCTIEEIDDVASDFLDGEIVDLASDWLGNTVVQKLFEKCSPGPRIAMLERVAPHLAMIGIHKNGTWAAQKVIECANTPDEITLIAINLRPYTPPLLLDQFGNYVVQCCLRFGYPANEFIFDAMTDRLWEIAQGRFGARSMRACLESPYITIQQQRRIATAVILNSIPLATNPNGALLLTWLLDTSGFHNRYRLLAPRFTPHLSHLCTHKLASVTVLRIVNQKSEPQASNQIVQALFFSQNDHVLSDVLGDQINGVAVVHKILQSPFLDAAQRPSYLEATKRVLIDLKVTTAQAYRRLIEEVGLPIPSFANAPTNYSAAPALGNGAPKKPAMPGMQQQQQQQQHPAYGVPQQGGAVPHGSYSPDLADPQLAQMMAQMQLAQMQQNAARLPQGGRPYGQIPMTQQGYPSQAMPPQSMPSATFSPTGDPFIPLPLRGDMDGVSPVQQQRAQYAQQHRANNGMHANGTPESYDPQSQLYGNTTPIMAQPQHAVYNGGMDQIPPSPYGHPHQIHPAMFPYLYQQMYAHPPQQQQQQQQQQQPQQPPNPHNGYH